MTKDADQMLCCLYREYLNRIKAGSSKTSARAFTAEYAESDDILSKWHPDDFCTTRNELKRAGYLDVNIIGNFRLNDAAISYMENRFKNNIKELTDFISKFPFLPGYTL